jgi:hypothetical protein
MAAPAATVRQSPTGIKLDDGFATLVTIKRFPAINLWEKTVTPPGLDGGDAVDTTTMHNLILRTKSPRLLRDMTEGSMTVAYDPGVLADCISAINVNDEITVRFPDGTTWAFWGYLRTFEPQEISEGEQPTANCSFMPTNQDNLGVERDPVVVSVTGT